MGRDFGHDEISTCVDLHKHDYNASPGVSLKAILYGPHHHLYAISRVWPILNTVEALADELVVVNYRGDVEP